MKSTNYSVQPGQYAKDINNMIMNKSSSYTFNQIKQEQEKGGDLTPISKQQQ